MLVGGAGSALKRNFSAMNSLLGGLKGLLCGVKDSVFGILPVYQLAKRSDAIRKQILQCFLLNGIILWLSIFLFDYAFLPSVQMVAGFLYGVIGDPSKSDVLSWLGPILWYVFTGFWVLPIFWISKPINSIWFQDIASTAFQESKKQEIKTRKKKSSASSLTLSQAISRFIADLLFSVVLELLFLIQATLVGLLPGVGFTLSILHMAMLYALYTFEYKWINEGWIVHQRVSYIERNWPYFLGFGLPLAVLTNLTSSIFISACVFGVLFPLFLVSANYAKPVSTSLSAVPVFKVSVILSNRLFDRRGSAVPTRMMTTPPASMATPTRTESLPATPFHSR